jgi:hypothetical protein
LSEDCKALDRFKRQRLALKRGRAVKETGHFTTEPIKPAVFSEKQFQACVDKLRCAGVTDEEMAFFGRLNNFVVSG